jgi:CDGSH-type Zn-finger protein
MAPGSVAPILPIRRRSSRFRDEVASEVARHSAADSAVERVDAGLARRLFPVCGPPSTLSAVCSHQNTEIQSMAEITIRLRPNGPLVIEGTSALDGLLKIVDQNGTAFQIPANKPVVALCRCGASAKKPFCDGAHKACGFISEELAAAPSPPAPA